MKLLQIFLIIILGANSGSLFSKINPSQKEKTQFKKTAVPKKPEIRQTTELHIATRNDDFGKVKELLDQKVFVDPRDESDSTPLMIASALGFYDIAQLLIENGADVNARSGTCGCSPILYASHNDHIELVKLLVSNKANVHEVDFDNDTVLTSPAKNGYYEIVEYFLENHQMDVNFRNKDNNSALDLAKRNGHGGIVSLLEKFGAK